MVRQNAARQRQWPASGSPATLATGWRNVLDLGGGQGALEQQGSDFAPAKVAERILGFIGGGWSRRKASGARYYRN